MQATTFEFPPSNLFLVSESRAKDHFEGLDFDCDSLLDYAETHAGIGEEAAMEDYPLVVRHLSGGCSYCWEIVEEHVQDYAHELFNS